MEYINLLLKTLTGVCVFTLKRKIPNSSHDLQDLCDLVLFALCNTLLFSCPSPMASQSQTIRLLADKGQAAIFALHLVNSAFSSVSLQDNILTSSCVVLGGSRQLQLHLCFCCVLFFNVHLSHGIRSCRRAVTTCLLLLVLISTVPGTFWHSQIV